MAAAEVAYQNAQIAPETIEENFSSGWKKHISIKNGIPLWIVFVTLLMIGGGILGVTGLKLSKADIQALYYEEMVPVQTIRRINFLMADNRTQVALALNFKFGAYSDVAINNPSTHNQMQVVAHNKSEIDRLWATYIANVKDTNEKNLANAYIQARGRYVNEGLLQAIEAIEAEDYLQAQDVFFNQINPLYDIANDHASSLLTYLSERANAKLVDVTAREDLIFKLAVAGITLSCLVLVVAGIFFFRITARPWKKPYWRWSKLPKATCRTTWIPLAMANPGAS